MLEGSAVTWVHEGVSFVTLPTIGENIVRLRKAAGFKKQGDFARKIGVPQSRVSDLEKDRYGLPDTATLIRVAKVLSCSIDRILNGVDPAYDVVIAGDLARHASDQLSGLPPAGGPNVVAASSRLFELEQEIDRLRSALAQVENVAGDLVQIAKSAAANDRTTATRSGGGSGHRTTRR